MVRYMRAVFMLLCLSASIAAASDGSYILIKTFNNCHGTMYPAIGEAKPLGGNVFIVAGLSIENHGYDSFSVDPGIFILATNSFEYKSSPATYYLDRVGLKPLPSGNLPNGGNIDGYVAFELPSGTSNYNVRYGGWENVEITYNCA
jgi:hypothetical protein